eukprot:6176340-Pleurochrysis_carterae.AAC.5
MRSLAGVRARVRGARVRVGAPALVGRVHRPAKVGDLQLACAGAGAGGYVVVAGLRPGTENAAYQPSRSTCTASVCVRACARGCLQATGKASAWRMCIQTYTT